MKKLILSAIMFLSVAGIAVAQDTTGTKQHKAGAMKDKKSGDWKKGKDSKSSGSQGTTGGKMKRDSTNH